MRRAGGVPRGATRSVGGPDGESDHADGGYFKTMKAAPLPRLTPTSS